MRTEFARVHQQQVLGLPNRDALLQLARRVPSTDLQVVITAMLVQKETGGNLVEILERTAAVLRDRLRIQGDVRVHTAQGRLTGAILCLLPVVMYGLINLANPGYTRVLIEDPVGRKMIYVGMGMIAIGGNADSQNRKDQSVKRMKPIYLLSVQLSVFCATALLSVWFMTRTTPAAKRLYGVTRLVPESAHGSAQALAEPARDHLPGPAWRLGAAGHDGERQAANAVSGGRAAQPKQHRRLLCRPACWGRWQCWCCGRSSGRSVSSVIALLAAGAYLGPDLWLKARTKRRREQIRLGLPDALDLMVVCVDAGLGLDQALLRTGQELGTSHPAIAEEFMLINLEQRAGKPRINAWRDMADRTQLETVKGFATMLAQSDRFGTPISRALGTFADDLRKKRSQQAQELAAKTTVKLMFPLVLFIFPSMFIVLLGPAALTISRNLGVLTGK